MLPNQESDTFAVKVPAKSFAPKEINLQPSMFEKKTGTICDKVYPSFNPLIDGVNAVVKEQEATDEKV